MQPGTRDDRQSSSQDDLTIQHQKEIESEISSRIPLIGPLEDLTVLETEYKADEVYYKKAKYLSTKYKWLRRVRPDGNCFFRAFGFSYLEYLHGNRREYEQFLEIVENCKDKLITMNYPDLTIKDIFDQFFDVATLVLLGQDFSEELYRVFNHQAHSDYVVSYLRLIVSAQLREHEVFYNNFMEDGKSVQEFCQRVVEPMNKESDHIHITALSSALRVSIRVLYMDRSRLSVVNAHDFQGSSVKSQSHQVVHLLYRPGHYDILYPNAQ